MADVRIEICQRGDSAGFDHGAFGIAAGKCADRIHRIPVCEYKEFDMTRGAAPAEIGAAESGYPAQLRKHIATECSG